LGLNEEMIQKVTKIALKINQSVEVSAEFFYKELKRKCYITPSHFLDFLNLYKILYEREKDVLPDRIKKFQNGLKKMKETKDQIEILKQRIIDNQPKIEKAK